ncbi:MAG: hypothetical protein L0220_11725 [Acidobacteria bacterium]|nr:hypothetical protein [Acidobacteriota bacterium]
MDKIKMRFFWCIPALILLLAAADPSSSSGQDLTFRLLNIERRLDQLQYRVDAIERTLQTQATNAQPRTSIPAEMVLELQRQQLSLAEQVITLQKQVLALTKSIDQINEKQEKKEKSREEPKAKPTGKP